MPSRRVVVRGAMIAFFTSVILVLVGAAVVIASLIIEGEVTPHAMVAVYVAIAGAVGAFVSFIAGTRVMRREEEKSEAARRARGE